MCTRHLLRVLFLGSWLLLSVAMHAQFDTNGPNARLTLQSLVPGVVDPVAHDVPVAVPGVLDLTIDSGTNSLAGVILLASAANPDGVNHIPVPWGGFVDVGNGVAANVLVFSDGIGYSVNPATDVFCHTSQATAAQPASRYSLTPTLTTSLCNSRVAVQAIVADPTMAPFRLDCTECGDANFSYGQRFTVLTAGGSVNVPFLPGETFEFHGVSYTDIWIHDNGYVSFGGAPTVALGGATIDAVSWMNAQPSIAVCMTDWNISAGGPADGVYFSEVGGRVRISWGDPRALPSGAIGVRHRFSLDTNNQLDLTLEMTVDGLINPCAASGVNPGAFTLAYPRFDANSIFRAGDGVLGHTPGGASLLGLQASTDLEGAGPVASAPYTAAVEEHNRTGGNASTIGWNGAGAARAFNEFRAWQGNAVTFSPTPGGVAGAFGYVAAPQNPPADIVLGLTVPSISTLGNPTVSAVGKFFGFNPGGSITITDGAGNIYPAIVGAVTGGTGPVFTNELITFATPPVAAGGNGTIRFNFGSGYVQTINVLFIVTNCPVVSAPVAIPPIGFAPYPLAVPVTMYGAFYTTMFLSAYGTIDFGAGNAVTISSLAGFFSGRGSVNNPGVAYLWCNLARNPATIFTVTEDACFGTVRVDATNLIFSNSLSPAGNIAVTFNSNGPDTVTFDYSAAVNDTFFSDNPVVGYTDGNTGIGSNTNLGTFGGFGLAVPTVYSTGIFGSFAPDSVAQQFASNTYATILGAINGTGTFTILNDGFGNLTIF